MEELKDLEIQLLKMLDELKQDLDLDPYAELPDSISMIYQVLETIRIIQYREQLKAS